MDQQTPVQPDDQPMQPTYPQQPQQPQQPIQPQQPQIQQQPVQQGEVPFQATSPTPQAGQGPPQQPPSEVGSQQINYMPQKSSAMKKIMTLGCVILVIVIGIGVVVGLFLYFGQQAEKESTTSTTTVAEEAPISSTWESEVVDVDGTWDRYENKTLGFLIMIPKIMRHNSGSCPYEEVEDHSYRLKSGDIPTKVFEDEANNFIYITSEYFYQLGGETQEEDKYYYSECNKVENTLAELGDAENWNQAVWKIVIKDIAEESELDAFIKDRYGQGCEYDRKTETDVEGIYDVVIGGEPSDDPAGDDPTKCNINYMTVVKYIPTLSKVVSWHRGQSCTFWKEGDDEWSSGCYDEEMLESFDLVRVN